MVCNMFFFMVDTRYMFFFTFLIKQKILLFKNKFKAAVRKFCLFVAISVWKPGIAPVCGIILLAWAVLWHGSSADESNVLRWMCSCQSPHRCGCLLYFTITDSSLCLGIYDPNKNFHRILSSEQVRNKSATFCPTEEKSIIINCATNGDLI